MRRSAISVAVVLVAHGAAVAQPVCFGDACPDGAAPAKSSGSAFHQRQGVFVGAGFGLGGIQVDGEELECASCGSRPIASELSFHVGQWIGEHSAVMLELQGSTQTISSSDDGDVRLLQGAALVAAQYWLSPRLWIKGGVGAATIANRFSDETEKLDSGLALLGGLGFELSSGARHAIDLQARLVAGNYDWYGQVRTASVGVGLSWY